MNVMLEGKKKRKMCPFDSQLLHLVLMLRRLLSESRQMEVIMIKLNPVPRPGLEKLEVN